MKIYTKMGDDGSTALLGGERVSKDSVRVAAYGTVDELNANIGLARAQTNDKSIDQFLANIQNDLFDLGADLASPHGSKARGHVVEIDTNDIKKLEQAIDDFEQELSPLKQFILPSGSCAAASLQVCRTIARRAERHVVGLAKVEKINPNAVKYLNRLSDLLFVLSRLQNKRDGLKEDSWQPKIERQ